jgi:hypothetical protein
MSGDYLIAKYHENKKIVEKNGDKNVQKIRKCRQNIKLRKIAEKIMRYGPMV